MALLFSQKKRVKYGSASKSVLTAKFEISFKNILSDTAYGSEEKCAYLNLHFTTPVLI
jgi:hypothetical protein